MANRFTLSDLWASTGEVADPDKDTTHPIYTPDRYSIGWEYSNTIVTANKEPHEWRNYYANLNLSRMLAVAESGISGWHENTNYVVGAVCKGDDGLVYEALAPSVGVNPVGGVANTWTAYTFGNVSFKDFTTVLDMVKEDLEQHRGTVTGNPHDVQATEFAHGVGYYDFIISLLVADEQTQLDTHKALKNNPHDVTHTQLNALNATAGGEFTGQTDFTGAFRLGNRGYYVSWFIEAFALSVGGYLELGIDNNGRPFVGASRNTNERSELFHTGNYDRLRMSQEAVFALPPAEFHLPLVASISSFSVGDWSIVFDRPSTLAYVDKGGNFHTADVDEDVYGIHGMYWSDDTTLFVGTGQVVMGECTIAWHEDGVLKHIDLPSWDGHVSVLVTDGTGAVRDFRVYPLLTIEQKTMLA